MPQNLDIKTAKNVQRCVFLIKNNCISQVSKCGFRCLRAYCQNRHAISQYIEIYNSQYIEIYNSQYIEILCNYSQYLNIRFFPLPVEQAGC